MKDISFCMIVKNAAPDLAEILPVMRTIAADMVIVDTGSTDATAAVARASGARVIPFAWVDSFAAARNAYIEAARGDWIISIDADERIAPTDLPLIAAAAGKAPQGFLMTTRNYGRDPSAEGFRPCRGEYPAYEHDFPGWAPSTKVRMFPRLPGVAYQGEVRELLEPSLQRLGLSLGEVLAPIHHYGVQNQAKRSYYHRLLERKVASFPNDPRALFELAVEEFHLGRYDQSVTHIEQTLALYRDGQRAAYFDPGAAYNLLGAAWMQRGERGKALEAFDTGIALNGPNREALERNRAILLKQSQSPTLGAIMIVRDEERNLGGILSDIRGCLDEVVVLDTGSRDGTVALAHSFGVTLGHFAWCDDFAAARNASIALARADYLLWLDADDRLDPAACQALRALKQRLRPEKDRAYQLKIVCETAGEGHTLSYQTRLFPNRPEIRFAGRVHEQIQSALERAGLPIESVDIPIRHTGYQTLEDRRAKAQRNLKILLEEHAAGQDTPRHDFQLAVTYFGLGEYAQCLSAVQRARAGGLAADWLKHSYILSSDSCLQLGRIPAALAELQAAVRNFPHSRILQYSLGAVALQAGESDLALAALEKALSLAPEIETFPVDPAIPAKLPYCYGQALERFGRLSEAEQAYRTSLKCDAAFPPAQVALGMVLLRTGRAREALPCLEEARRLSPGYNHALTLSLAAVSVHLDHVDEALALYREAIAHAPADREALIGLIRTCIARDDVEGLVGALEGLMQSLGMDTDRDIDSVDQIAELMAQIGRRLLEGGDAGTARTLGEDALALGNVPAAAMLMADISLAQHNRPEAIAFLEKAARWGAPNEDIQQRIQRL